MRVPAPATAAAAVALLALALASAAASDLLADSDLVMALLVHRHGDRAPVTSSLGFSTDPAALQRLTAPYGYGQLTDEGKRTGYRVGQWIRARYDSMLSAHYNSSEIYIRCTDSARTKMTALTAMAAVFPASHRNWHSALAWQPTPYTTVPARYDSNLAMLNCPTFVNFYHSQFASNPARMSRHAAVLERWSAASGFNLTHMPLLAYPVYDVYTSQMSLGLPLGGALEELLPDIEAAAGEAIDMIFGDDNYTLLQSGVLLQEFVSAAAAAARGEPGQRVRVLSAHDYNVYSLMAAARVPRQGVPPYGAVFALELRRLRSGALAVLPVYVRSPGAAPQYLPVRGCSALPCALDEFVALTGSARLDERTWREQCQYTDDFPVDDSDIA